MLRKAIKLAALFCFFVSVAGCKTSFKIQTETFSRSVGTESKSFKFFNPQNLPKSNFSFSEENKKIIFDAVADEFKNMGYSSHQKAALLVKVQGGTVTERETRERYAQSPYYGRGMYYYPSFNNFYQDISGKKTTIIIDVIDAATDKILWQGVATGEMGKKPEEVEDKLKVAVHEIIKEFPFAN